MHQHTFVAPSHAAATIACPMNYRQPLLALPFSLVFVACDPSPAVDPSAPGTLGSSAPAGQAPASESPTTVSSTANRLSPDPAAPSPQTAIAAVIPGDSSERLDREVEPVEEAEPSRVRTLLARGVEQGVRQAKELLTDETGDAPPVSKPPETDPSSGTTSRSKSRAKKCD